MALFKVGDKVTIRSDLKTLKGRIEFGLAEEMLSFAGNTYTISEVIEGYYTPAKPNEDGCRYRLKTDSSGFSWSSEAFVTIKNFFKVGDKVTVRPDLKNCASGDVKYGLDEVMREYSGGTVTISEVEVDAYDIARPAQDGCLYRIKEDDGDYSWSSEMFIINNLKSNQNENQLQGKEAVVSRGDKREGRTVCCRRSKAAVKRGYLSHKALSGD